MGRALVIALNFPRRRSTAERFSGPRIASSRYNLIMRFLFSAAQATTRADESQIAIPHTSLNSSDLSFCLASESISWTTSHDTTSSLAKSSQVMKYGDRSSVSGRHLTWIPASGRTSRDRLCALSTEATRKCSPASEPDLTGVIPL